MKGCGPSSKNALFSFAEHRNERQGFMTKGMMKAALLTGKESLHITEVPIPEISGNEMLLKVRAASICGTDVRMYQNGYKHVDAEHPLILGHEFSGDIAVIGENIVSYNVGQKVSVAPNIGCGVCDMCVSGNTHLCRNYQAFGVTMNGGFAEYVRIPEMAIRQGNVSPLKEDISYPAAALVEPLSCVYNGQKLLNAPKGAETLIIGMGPIGIMHIMIAKIFGAGRIFINDLNNERVNKAKELIPDVIPLQGDIMDGLRRNGVEGVDVCIIAAPAASAQTQSLEYMNTNGKILYFGGLPAGRENVTINTNLIHYKQLTIQGCSKQSVSEYRLCAKMVNDGRIPLNLIMSDSYSIDRFQEAMDNAAATKGLKHVILFD